MEDNGETTSTIDDVFDILNPTHIDFDYASGHDITITGDIDSIIACSYTMEPFRCNYSCSIDMRPKTISRSKNTKLTLYLSKRKKFAQRHPRKFHVASDRIYPDNHWYEFVLGSIDDRQLNLLFQIDDNCALLKDVPRQPTAKEGGQLRVSCNYFIAKFVQRAARLLNKNTETAKGGLRYLRHNVHKTFPVVAQDYTEFCRLLSEVLRTKSLHRTCGMTCVRFYIAKHGLRLQKSTARDLLYRALDVRHPHLHVLQIHRADTLSCDDGDVLLVKLDGNEQESLRDTFRNAINISGKLDKYRTSFFSDFGYFRKHASPPLRDNAVTYIQAYSSAVKMARPSDSGYVASYVLCRGYSPNLYKDLKQLSQSTRQYIRDVISYALNYVRERQALRIEEVFTLDTRRFDDIDVAIRDLRIFDENALCYATSLLVQRRLVYRFTNWTRYFDAAIGPDIHFLSRLLDIGTNLSADLWPRIETVAQTIKAEFRVMYLLHGRNTSYNYNVMRLMYSNGNETKSSVNGIIQLRPLYDPTTSDQYIFPLFSAQIPNVYTTVIRFLYETIQIMDNEIDNEDDDDNDKVLKFLVTCYASYGYTHCFLNKSHLRNIDRIKIVKRITQNYKSIFTLTEFLRRFRKIARQRTNINIVGTVQADYLARKILSNPTSPFGKIISSTINATNRTDLFEKTSRLIKDNFYLFPAKLIEYKPKNSKTILKLSSWVIVKCGDYRLIPQKGLLTIKTMRNNLLQLRKIATKRRIRRVRTSTSSGSDRSDAKSHVAFNDKQATPAPTLQQSTKRDIPKICKPSAEIPIEKPSRIAPKLSSDSAFLYEDAPQTAILLSTHPDKPSYITQAIPGTSKQLTPFIPPRLISPPRTSFPKIDVQRSDTGVTSPARTNEMFDESIREKKRTFPIQKKQRPSARRKKKLRKIWI